MGTQRIAIDEGRLRTMWAADFTTAEIGSVFGCSPQLVSLRAKRLGLLPRKASSGLPGEAMQAAYDAGYNLRDLKSWLSRRFPTVAPATIAAALRRRGVNVTRSRKHISKNLPPLGVL